MTGNQEAENALQDLLELIDSELEPLRVELAKAHWHALTDGSAEAHEAVQEAEKAMRFGLNRPEYFDELGIRLADPGIQDLKLRRWGHLLRLEMAPHRLPDETILDLIARERNIEKTVNNYRPEVDGEELTVNQIQDILRHSKDVKYRKKVWEASKEIGNVIGEELHDLVRTRNLAARQLGFPDHYRMQLELQEIDEARMFSQMGRFASLSEEPFRRLKAKLDRLVADQFKIEAIDLAPWHYADPFFQECPPVIGIDVDPVFKDHDIIEWNKRYFHGMGLSIDSIVNNGDYEERTGKYPHALCADIDRKGDVRVLMNLKNNAYWSGVALHEFGHAVYSKNIDTELPHTLRNISHLAVTEASALFFERNASDIEWLAEEFALTGKEIRELEKPLKLQQRLQMAISTRWMLVMIHFERGLYRDPDHDQQQRWWDLVERFQLIRAPEGREVGFDWATKIHIATAPVYYHNYLLGQWIASMLHYQMQMELKLRDPIIWHSLPQVGKWLKEKVYKPGAFWEFSELIRNITGDVPKPDLFINQFFRGL